MNIKNLVAELFGTAILVFFAVGVATLSFGFRFDGISTSAGIVATALAFGLVLMALAYAIGPLSGCHVNPAVTIGFLVSGRLPLRDAIGYWVAQFVGGILGALALWGVFSGSPEYSTSVTGLGADGFGKNSMIHINAGGAFAAEVILTFLFVFVVLMVTSRTHASTSALAGVAIGFALTVVHLIGIPITGTSVNPARSLGPALIVGGSNLSQIWLFIIAPLVGGIIAAAGFRYFEPANAGQSASAPRPADSEAASPADPVS
ncbi:MAG: MIP family channel protein [Acidimicrobiaceae bacterium]|nr:MIP family channel protein [Acidimicrobiaceae bacterium]